VIGRGLFMFWQDMSRVESRHIKVVEIVACDLKPEAA
jgi:hypothetical protein